MQSTVLSKSIILKPAKQKISSTLTMKVKAYSQNLATKHYGINCLCIVSLQAFFDLPSTKTKEIYVHCAFGVNQQKLHKLWQLNQITITGTKKSDHSFPNFISSTVKFKNTLLLMLYNVPSTILTAITLSKLKILTKICTFQKTSNLYNKLAHYI